MIDSKTKRAKLKARREPYWWQLRAGSHVGYRKVSEGEGAWIAKWRDPATGKRHYRALGTILDTDSRSAFDEAKRQAAQWFDSLDSGVSPTVVTVKDICDQYVAHIQREGNEVKTARTMADFRRLVYADQLAAIELPKLRASHLEAWRDRISAKQTRVGRGKKLKGTPRAPATVNRDIVPLRAALNRALSKRLVLSDLEWREALKPLAKADRRREIYLDLAQRKALLAAASDEVKPLLRGFCLLPLRPGALAALKVGDFNPRLHSLRVGVDKAGADRRIMVPPETSKFLAEQGKSKLPTAPLFTRADGSAWTKDTWKWPVKDAVVAAAMPLGTTAYTLRHSTITDLVTAGLDLLTVAQISGTSVAMVEAHYGHLRQHRAAQALAQLSL